MKRKNTLNRTVIFVGITLSAFMFQACNKDEDAAATVSNDEEVAIVENSNDAESISEEDVQLLDQTIAEADISGGRVSEGDRCAVVTRDEEAKTITIDFGDGCVGPYGRERSGKVIITYGGEFDDNMANRVITFDNYYVNNKNITGTILLRDINRNDEGNLTVTRSLEDYTIHYPDGNSFVINGSTTREWLEGEGDGQISTNVFKITGSQTGISTRGRSFTHTITEPVIANFGCRASGGFVRTAGIKELVVSNIDKERTRTVDYGDGTCDNEITVTINGKVYTITAS